MCWFPSDYNVKRVEARQTCQYSAEPHRHRFVLMLMVQQMLLACAAEVLSSSSGGLWNLARQTLTWIRASPVSPKLRSLAITLNS